ncbi:TPA: DUF551 domain-containing protein [Escherichia coli]|nr:DUF551 domain-containing protein [Escherichia coli]EEZ9486668.1 DUF551 domain-containing protein [Escherichia coli]EFL7406833.1 DUF551 domain-containing protein [Escherichia coli]EFL9800230.1 DUF551 domain-containing protein [Escherichia coli]EHJ8891691.1 DUF551 domain-containing protein [Escherichia coli]
MTTITKERAEIKSFITGFLSDPAHDNQSSDSLLANVFRIALASLEAEPVAWMRDDADGREYNARNEFSGGGGGIPLYATPQVQVVPEEMYWQDAPVEGSSKAAAYATGWNDCREAMLQSGNFRENKDSSTNNFRKIPEASTSSPVTPALLPGGFTIEEAKELHEDLVRSHISKALSGEKMKKKDRDADLRWIHGVIVQAAWFVKASLEQNALSGNYPVTPDGWISCSERIPEETGDIIVVSDGIVMSGISYSRRDGFYIAALEYDDDEPIDGVTHWMPLPEPPQG